MAHPQHLPFKRQLVAENVHSEIDCEDAKLQMQQTTCIYQEPSVKEEELIKANELQFFVDYSKITEVHLL
jgi:hypothetical protein